MGQFKVNLVQDPRDSMDKRPEAGILILLREQLGAGKSPQTLSKSMSFVMKYLSSIAYLGVLSGRTSSAMPRLDSHT
jgi:hypothetical protein